MNEEALLVFPCEFPVKVMGRDTAGFRCTARDIVERHTGELEEHRVRSRLSRKGAFLALTFTIPAESREQLDRLYEELSANDEVLIVL